MALKDDVLQKALTRTPKIKTKTESQYSHFKIYETPNSDNNLNVETGHKPDTNQSNTDNKLVTNQQKSGTKVGSNWDQSGVETGTKVGTNWDQSGTKVGPITNEETPKLGSEVGPISGPKWDQSGTKVGPKQSFYELTGLQRSIVILLHNDCSQNRSKTTNPITLEHIAINIKTTTETVKTAIKRLVKKGCLIRKESKNGRGGWSKYELPEDIFIGVLKTETGIKVGPKWDQSGTKVGSEVGSEVGPSLSSSSSIINNIKTTTTSDIKTFELTDEWVEIDISPLEEVGFTKTHLVQIASHEKLHPSIVQNSINAFAFDLKHNGKASSLTTNPVNFFMGILRNGRPYAPPDNYESPEDKALRIYHEKTNALEKRRLAIEKEAFETAFKEWYLILTVQEKDNIMPDMVKKLTSEQPKISSLREHFREKIWPEKKIEIINA